jgi:hypothetical protein
VYRPPPLRYQLFPCLKKYRYFLKFQFSFKFSCKPDTLCPSAELFSLSVDGGGRPGFIRFDHTHLRLCQLQPKSLFPNFRLRHRNHVLRKCVPRDRFFFLILQHRSSRTQFLGVNDEKGAEVSTLLSWRCEMCPPPLPPPNGCEVWVFRKKKCGCHCGWL